MAYVDFILNLAGLLLWIKWRSLPFDPIHKRIPATLVGTLRRAAPSRFRRWHLLAAIGGLLILRAVIYWWIGPALTQVWIGKLDLGVAVLPFRSGWFLRVLFFSLFSFGRTLGIFYLCLLLLSLLKGTAAAINPVQQQVRMQLGGIDGWPVWARILSPLAAMAAAWWLASWLLAWLEIIPQPLTPMHRIEESIVMGLGAYLVWKYVAAALLVLSLLNTYIYFGRHSIWKYINATAQTLLAPLRKVSLRAGKVDFAPVVGIVIVFLADEMAGRGLAWIYTRLPL